MNPPHEVSLLFTSVQGLLSLAGALRNITIDDLAYSRGHCAEYFVLKSVTCFGGCRPGDCNHAVMRNAVSVCRTRIKSTSRSLPGGTLSACARYRRASSVSRSSKVSLCFTRRRTWVIRRSSHATGPRLCLSGCVPARLSGDRQTLSSWLRPHDRGLMFLCAFLYRRSER